MGKKNNSNEHKTKIGGQALIEGIMMRGIHVSSMACRLPDGTIDVETWPIRNGKDAPWYAKVPFIRGCYNYVVSLVDGYKCMMKSADKTIADDDEPETKFEKWLDKHIDEKQAEKIVSTLSFIMVIVTLAFTILLLKFVPMWLSSLLGYIGAPGIVKTIAEAVIKLGIIVGYMWIISYNKTIKTTFMYHGAEHKSIACYEAGLDLTVENIRKQTRFHPRCGTSFIIITVFIAVIIAMFITWDNIWLRLGIQLLLLPLEIAVAYELIKLAGRYTNPFTKIISAPGIWLQHITTKEPDDKQIEVAIEALKPCLPVEDKSEDLW